MGSMKSEEEPQAAAATSPSVLSVSGGEDATSGWGGTDTFAAFTDVSILSVLGKFRVRQKVYREISIKLA